MALLTHRNTQLDSAHRVSFDQLFDRLDGLIESVSKLGVASALEGVLLSRDRGEYRVVVDASKIILICQWRTTKQESTYFRSEHRLIVNREEATIPVMLVFANDVYTVLKSGKSRIIRYLKGK